MLSDFEDRAGRWRFAISKLALRRSVLRIVDLPPRRLAVWRDGTGERVYVVEERCPVCAGSLAGSEPLADGLRCAGCGERLWLPDDGGQRDAANPTLSGVPTVEVDDDVYVLIDPLNAEG